MEEERENDVRAESLTFNEDSCGLIKLGECPLKWLVASIALFVFLSLSLSLSLCVCVCVCVFLSSSSPFTSSFQSGFKEAGG